MPARLTVGRAVGPASSLSSPAGARSIRTALPTLALLVGLGLAGCDPCAGVLSCGEPQLRYEGLLLHAFLEGPAEAVPVEFVRTGGAELDTPVLRAQADSSGRFRFDAAVRGDGPVIGDLTIHPVHPLPPIRVPRVELRPSRARGNVTFLGTWEVPHPYLRHLGEFVYLGTNTPAEGVEVEFRRTGGIAARPERFREVTSEHGRFSISPAVHEHGELVGELHVLPLPPLQPFVIPDVRVSTLLDDSPIVLGGRWELGLNLPYVGFFAWEDTGEPAEGVEVEITRSGGVPVRPEHYITHTNRFGTFGFTAEPLLAGDAIVDLIVRPPGDRPSFTIRDVRLPAASYLRARELAGVWVIPRQEAE